MFLSRIAEKSIRQIDPAFVAAVADDPGGFGDQLRDVVENTAVSRRRIVVDESLPPDHLDRPAPAKMLAGETALPLNIRKLEHEYLLFSDN